MNLYIGFFLGAASITALTIAALTLDGHLCIIGVTLGALSLATI